MHHVKLPVGQSKGYHTMAVMPNAGACVRPGTEGVV